MVLLPPNARPSGLWVKKCVLRDLYNLIEEIVIKHLLGNGLFARCRHQSRSVAVAKALGSKQLCVARSAMDLLVWSIAGQSRVERTTALGTAEAFLVPHGTLGQLLFSGKHSAATTWASFASCGLDGRSVYGRERLGVCNLFITVQDKAKFGLINKHVLYI